MKPSRKRSETAKSAAKPRDSLVAEVDHLGEGLGWHSEAKVPFRRLHSHDHVEISVNEFQKVVAMFGGERVVLPPNNLVVFWAARPHGPIETAPGGWAHGIHVPTSWIVQWRLPPLLLRTLFGGKVILDYSQSHPEADLDRMKDWAKLLEQGSEENRRIVLLEAEARLRRLANTLATREPMHPHPAPPSQSSGALGRFEKMAKLLVQHFSEPLSIGDIAEAVRMQPASAMRLFRRFSGMTIHDFLLQQRVSNAQRLLSTTDMKIDAVAAESGFGSTARFYASFQKVVDKSPAAYRRAVSLR